MIVIKRSQNTQIPRASRNKSEIPVLVQKKIKREAETLAEPTMMTEKKDMNLNLLKGSMRNLEHLNIGNAVKVLQSKGSREILTEIIIGKIKIKKEAGHEAVLMIKVKVVLLQNIKVEKIIQILPPYQTMKSITRKIEKKAMKKKNQDIGVEAGAHQSLEVRKTR